jgi:hypothetical protein
MARHPVSGALGGWKGFGLGIAASVLIEAVAPELTKSAAPAARSALKFLFRLTDEVGRHAGRAREQMEDFVASTRAEYDAERDAAATREPRHEGLPEVNGPQAPEVTG